MLIGGYQKTTLLDFPERVACIIFTHGCNFRCPWCHNATLVTEAFSGVSEDEIFAFLSKRKGILDGVVISGGEPLLQSGIFELIKKIKAMGYDIKLDTNGTYPEKLKELISAGLLDYIAMDIKNSREKYAQTSGVDNVDISRIEHSVDIIKESGVPYEFRTTLTREQHSPEDIVKIGEWIKGARKYFLQGFTDSGNLVGEGHSAYTPDEMQAMADSIKELVLCVKVR